MPPAHRQLAAILECAQLARVDKLPRPSTNCRGVSSAGSTRLEHVASLLQGSDKPGAAFMVGDAARVLAELPSHCIDVCMTSPPYWRQRQYQASSHAGAIGLESSFAEYLAGLLAVLTQVKRVLKPTGSLWLNLGDTYVDKCLLGMPWRVALALTDQQGWVLRNDIVWHKLKGGPDHARDKLRNLHEHVFHFVKQRRGYYYDVDAIRKTPGRAQVKNGSIVSATGVTGVRYKRQIELSCDLTADEKQTAIAALNDMLKQVADGTYADFRMVIRGRQRTTHSNSTKLSGRARELRDRGFYFLKYHPKGAKPSDVWEILPEDTHGRSLHFAPYPADLCRLPLLATCPKGGVVLDPFCGTGTTNVVATELGYRSIGIDRVPEYIELARARCLHIQD